MNRIAIISIVLLSLVLSSCGTFEVSVDITPTAGNPANTADNPTQTNSAPVISLASTSAEIRQALLESATLWKTIWLDGTVTWYAQDGSGTTQVFHEQTWIEPAASRFRVVLSGMNSDSPETFKACDGTSILEMKIPSGQSQSSDLPTFAKNPVPDSSPHVLWGQIGTPISEIALSSNYAADNGTFKPIAAESIAGRDALIVELTRNDATLPQWRMWLDTQTAVILKLQEFGKGGGEDLQGERVVNEVVFNRDFDESLFRAPAVTPQFGDVTGGSASDQVTEPVPPSGEDALGQLYFFTLPHQAGQSVQLVRLPGSCAAGLAQCPHLETIKVPFLFNFNLNALSWSPDGKLAAFAYSDNANGTPTKLWLFDPTANTWTSIAEFPFIDPPFWSPDGTWIAFRVQDGTGGEDVYAVRRDGSELKNLTASGRLPADGRPYVMDGWFTENIIVRSALPGSTGGVYLLRVSDGSIKPMFEKLLTKATFIPSPDNALLAYDDYDYNSQKHSIKVIEPDGGNPMELASFSGGSLYPIVWSPDGQELGYVSYSISGQPSADVYVIGRDGRGSKQIYKGITVGRILFSPDGKYLLVEETTSPTGGHLFVINLDTLEQKLISAPGLSLDTDWYAPSWRP